jgi:hypothetical protein
MPNPALQQAAPDLDVIGNVRLKLLAGRKRVVPFDHRNDHFSILHFATIQNFHRRHSSLVTVFSMFQ